MRNMILLFSVIMTIGCNSNQLVVNEKVVFDPNSSFKFEDMISNYEIIPIRLNDEVILSGEEELSFVDNLFYLIDYNINKRITVLNEKGEYRNNIGAAGNGNGEYLNFCDYHFNGDTVSLFSNLLQEEFCYLRTGEFVKKKKINTNFMKVLPIDSKNSFFYLGYDAGGIRKRVIEMENEEIKRELFDSDAKVLQFGEIYPTLLSTSKGIIVRETISNDLYLIDKENKENLMCRFDFGDCSIPDEYYKKENPMDAAMALMSQKYATNGRLLINDYVLIHQIGFNSPEGVSYSYAVKKSGENQWNWINFELKSSECFAKGAKFLDKNNDLYFLFTKEAVEQFISKGLNGINYPNDLSSEFYIIKCKLKL